MWTSMINDDGMWYHEGRVYVGGIEDDAMYDFMFFLISVFEIL